VALVAAVLVGFVWWNILRRVVKLVRLSIQ